MKRNLFGRVLPSRWWLQQSVSPSPTLASCQSILGGRRWASTPPASAVRVDRHSPSGTKRVVPDDGLTLGDFVGGNLPAKTKTAAAAVTKSQSGRSFHIKTFGCQMNVNDSDIVRAILLEKGYEEARTEEEADVWLTNTCAIRDKAEQRVWQRLRGLKAQKRRRVQERQSSLSSAAGRPPSNTVVGLLGCMAERLQEELLEEQMADLVVGPDAYRDLPNLLDDLFLPENPPPNAMNVELSLEETYQDIVPIRDSQSPFPFSAFVSIQRGCSNRCSFCIVPFTRGQERSRPLDSIVAEVEQLVEEQGLKEVVLLGQNVNSYHDRSEAALEARPLANTPGLSNAGFKNRVRRPSQGGYTFVDLVDRIADVSPELRVRFTSPHPKDYPSELLSCMAERPNVCNQLHLPAQSGSTTMLKRMKRGYSREAYSELIQTVRSIIPDVALSSDFIAGFCGETEEEHKDTLGLLEEVEYEQAFLFAYSLREKTHAHRVMEDDVPSEIKQRRLQELINIFRERVHAKNERVEVGKLRLVLIEGPAKRQKAPAFSALGNTITWHGRTDQNKRIMFPVLEGPSENSAIAMEEGVASWVSQQSPSSNLSIPPSIVTPDMAATTTPLVPGEYGVVEVTEAKGHTLRGRLLWKTTLANFARPETQQIVSQLERNEMDGWKQQMSMMTG